MGIQHFMVGRPLQGSIGKDDVVALIGLPGFDIVDLKLQVRQAFLAAVIMSSELSMPLTAASGYRFLRT